MRHSDRFRKAALSAELVRVSGLIDAEDGDTEDRLGNRVAQLVQTIKHALADNQLDEAERALEELRSVAYGILRERPAFLAAYFQHLAKAQHLALDDSLHERLVSDGVKALEDGDVDELRSVIGKLLENRVSQDIPSHDLAALADLTAH